MGGLAMDDEDGWEHTTWQGNRRRQHLEFLALPLREKLLIVEQMGEVAEELERKRIRRKASGR